VKHFSGNPVPGYPGLKKNSFGYLLPTGKTQDIQKQGVGGPTLKFRTYMSWQTALQQKAAVMP
jgi:hypothetical protein